MRAFLFVAACFSLFAQGDQRDRGQTRPPDNSQSWTHGRLGTQQPIPSKAETFTGVLLDASCPDRTSLNLAQPPVQPKMAIDEKPAPASTGIQVDPKILKKERADIEPHLTKDVVMRQSDPSCAITAATKEFSLLLANGRLLDLNSGGNTFAMTALLAMPEGRALLNGLAGSIKPQANIQGRTQGDRLIVEKFVNLPGATSPLTIP